MSTQDPLGISPDLSRSQFERISRILYQECGINLTEGKEGLVKSRLAKRLRKLGIRTFDQYIHYLQEQESTEELSEMVDALTTNKTSFFREPRHFEFLRDRVVPLLMAGGVPIRIWSAGCSSGEEPYSLAMLLRESIPDIERYDVRILATDICNKILTRAREGLYHADALAEVPEAFRRKYFTAAGKGQDRTFRVNDRLRELIRFARLNLMEQWPMRGPFDLILCRNVMIYFDKKTQSDLVGRFWRILKKGGYLFVGHSESLTNSTHAFSYIQPAVYAK